MLEGDRFEIRHRRPRNVEEHNLSQGKLCASCQHSAVQRRKGKLELRVYCREMARFVPPDLVECSRYRRDGAMSLYEMQEIGLPIDAREGSNPKSYL